MAALVGNSKSVQNCRLSLYERPLPRAVSNTGLTSGRVDLGTVSAGKKTPKLSKPYKAQPYKRQRGTTASVKKTRR